MAQIYETKMTSGSIYKHMLGFALPLFVSQLFQQLYNTADSIIVGQYLGTDSLAAVSSAGNLIFLIIAFFGGTSTGAGVLISKRYGEGDIEGCKRAAKTILAFGVVCGVVLTVFGVFGIEMLLSVMNIDPDIYPLALEYYRMYFIGSISHLMYEVGRGILMAVGDSKKPLFYLVLSSGINIILDILFVGVFRWGVWSAALATIISQFVSAVLCIHHLCTNGGSVQVKLREVKFYKEELKLILKYGLPAGIQNSVIGLANVVVQANINGFTKIATAAYGSYSKIEGFVFLPITSFTMSITTFIGQNLGAKEYERAKKGARFGILSAVVFAELIGFIVMSFSDSLFGLFSDDPEVWAFGARQIRTIAPFYFLLAYAHAVASVCRGAGKAVVPMTIMLICWCIIRVAWIEITMHLFNDIVFVYWAYPITWGLSCILYFLYYYFSDWVHGFEKKKRVLHG